MDGSEGSEVNCCVMGRMGSGCLRWKNRLMDACGEMEEGWLKPEVESK